MTWSGRARRTITCAGHLCAGYDAVPADLMLVVTELVGEAYSARTHIGETSHASSGATTVAFSREAMHQAVLARLNNYILAAPL